MSPIPVITDFASEWFVSKRNHGIHKTLYKLHLKYDGKIYFPRIVLWNTFLIKEIIVLFLNELFLY